MHIISLPLYLPDFNPIEEAFSSIKAHIWQYWNYIQGELAGNPHRILLEAVYSVTPEKAHGWYCHAGYV
ncbi:hypothetical protein BS47DRAFT_1296093 [Hydnum rufescens UP504]|uniref:Tc1-like transposase DDE domain-containing protein n=1 Tax=Hydnum rufescens UP504 TaxID=1448309 RepID=A0A9P6AXK6_9AGAM|nr:hypothetical protein BS47DRAFT_1296093 [Hydnum rufescens UP504]